MVSWLNFDTRYAYLAEHNLYKDLYGCVVNCNVSYIRQYCALIKRSRQFIFVTLYGLEPWREGANSTERKPDSVHVRASFWTNKINTT